MLVKPRAYRHVLYNRNVGGWNRRMLSLLLVDTFVRYHFAGSGAGAGVQSAFVDSAAETLTFHAVVVALTHCLGGGGAPGPAILLSQLSTLFTLAILILWQHEPQPPQPASGSASGSILHTASSRILRPLDAWNVGWSIRTLVGGLSAGVALGVTLPRRPLTSTAILLAAWSAQLYVANMTANWHWHPHSHSHWER